MPDVTLFTVDEDDIGAEEITRDDLAHEIRGAPKGAWAMDEDWPVLFAQVRDDEGHEATLVVPFDEPKDFQSFVDDNNLDKDLVVQDFDFDILERIESEMA